MAGIFIDWISPGSRKKKKNTSDSCSTPASKWQTGEKPSPFSSTYTMDQQLGMLADLPENEPDWAFKIMAKICAFEKE